MNNRIDIVRSVGKLRAQGLSLAIIAIRLGISEGQASKLAKEATQLSPRMYKPLDVEAR